MNEYENSLIILRKRALSTLDDTEIGFALQKTDVVNEFKETISLRIKPNLLSYVHLYNFYSFPYCRKMNTMFSFDS